LGVREVQIGKILAGKEIVVTALEHEAGELSHDRLGLEVKVLEHFIRMPAANEADDVGVNMSEEKGHSPTGTEGVRVDIIGKEAYAGTEGGDGEAEGEGDVGRCDRMVAGLVGGHAVVVGG
jgi:hypothetical protein